MSERDHATDGGSCWCGPTVEFVGDGHIVIHNQDCYVSRHHENPAQATVHGTYINEQGVWFCEQCAVTGEALGLFTRD